MSDNKRYHLIGIAGAGMSGLARVLHSRGAYVTGSDASVSLTLQKLEAELGLSLFVGNKASNIEEAKPDLVIATAAVKGSNPELIAAQALGIPVVSRAEFLGSLMSEFPIQVAITGTHGKTTTTAMVAQMLDYAGLHPTALVGSNVPAWHSNTLVGGADLIVAEACEAFGSFLSVLPTHTIITNIEADHLDHYGSFDAVVDAFREFTRQTSDVVICCAENGCSDLVAPDAGIKLITYGIGEGDVQGVELGPGLFDVIHAGENLGPVQIDVPGRHNILNALSAVSLGLSLELPFAKIADGLAQFSGTERRFEILGETANGALVVDDYAHHPTEIRATLAAAHQKYPGRRIVALFQPHLPSRTQQLMDDFAASFSDADKIVITDIYLAREVPIDGIDSIKLTEKIEIELGGNRVAYGGDIRESIKLLDSIILSGDVVLTLGAGSVRSAGEALLQSNKVLEAVN